MSKFLEIYNGNPTAGDVDGTPVSEGTFTNPVGFVCDDDDCYVKLAARCRDNLYVDGNIAVRSNDSNVTLCVDDGYDADSVKEATFAPTISISGLKSTNKIFWAKASKDAASGTSVQLEVQAAIKKENASS